jgi:hypothetical protein
METCPWVYIFKVPWVFISNVGQKSEIVRSFQSVQRRIPATFVNSDKAYLLNHWSYEDAWRPIGKKRKSSIALLFNPWSESSHNSTGFMFSDHCLRSSQIWYRRTTWMHRLVILRWPRALCVDCSCLPSKPVIWSKLPSLDPLWRISPFLRSLIENHQPDPVD